MPSPCLVSSVHHLSTRCEECTTTATCQNQRSHEQAANLASPPRSRPPNDKMPTPTRPVFDMLAFKNDIGFWKNNKSMKGLSARTILINSVCQLIIFLYLLDNETSFVVLMSSGVGTAIEFWKVTKAMNVTLDRRGRLPRIRFRDRASYSQSQTDRYDAEAMRYLSYVLYPLVVGYAIYALAYQTHKSWYSWVLNSLVGAVYTFGFILMCPQLYLNYKLKSVAHLPW